MRWGAAWLTVAAAGLLAGPVRGQDPLADARARLTQARAASRAAADRAAALEAAAAAERNAAARARTEEQAVVARIARAEADLTAAQARLALAERLLGEQRARLAERQAPAARLLAALTQLARRPAVVAIAQPGSLEDVVRVRAVLGAALPVIRARTAELRAELGRTRALRADAAAAAQGLAAGQAALDRERRALLALRTRHEAAATRLVRGALAESDRALALGEAARDLIDRMAAIGATDATLEALRDLPGPPAGAVPALPRVRVYRLPAAGRLVTGLGEVSDNGVRARGLTIAVAPGARVLAPAGGRVLFAKPFRGYGGIVIIDHGAGWSSLVTGLGAIAAQRGAHVRMGAPLGRARGGEEPAITVELRRRGRPVDITALIG